MEAMAQQEKELDFAQLPELPAGLAERIERIRMVVFDVDGTLTDGRIIFHAQGEQKNFSVQDGAGLKF